MVSDHNLLIAIEQLPNELSMGIAKKSAAEVRDVFDFPTFGQPRIMGTRPSAIGSAPAQTPHSDPQLSACEQEPSQ